MTKTVAGVVTEVRKVNYSFTNSDGEDQSMTDNKITVETTEGRKVTASKHTKASTQFDVPVGTEVQMTYEETTKNFKGKPFVSKKVTQFTMLNQNPTTKSVVEKEVKSTVTAVKSQTASVDWAAKDLSMEVSGLLQAIISHHGLDSKTEERLRTALTLKRTVAKDYADGKVPVTKTKSTPKAEEYEEEKVDVQDGEECPFDLE